jgi:hypothetical protein
VDQHHDRGSIIFFYCRIDFTIHVAGCHLLYRMAFFKQLFHGRLFDDQAKDPETIGEMMIAN